METDILEIKELVQNLYSAFTEKSKQIGTGKPGILHLPVADEKQVSAFEHKMGYVFPPSYRAFLQLHNGWEKFNHVYTLTGISGSHTNKVIRSVKETMEIYKLKWEEKFGKANPDKIEEFKSSSDLKRHNEFDAGIYLPHTIPFGTDHRGHLFYFYPSRFSTTEMQIIQRDKHGNIVRRYRDFIAFLKVKLEFSLRSANEEASGKQKSSKKSELDDITYSK